MNKGLAQKSVRSGLIVLVSLLAATIVGASDGMETLEVKKSKSGICHCPGGQFYDKVKNYTAYDNIDACLASGGRNPKRGQGDCPTASSGSPASTSPSENVPASKRPDSHEQGSSGQAAAQKVKKSKSGICHCPGGQFYDRVKNYTAYDNIDACLASGGRNPKLGQGDCSVVSSDSASPHDPAASRQPSEYDRNAFGGWSDDDQDCQNTRHERLVVLSTSPVSFSEDGCLVVDGHWKDPYTGMTFTSAQSLDIDHLVPLYYAWKRGASRWDDEKRQRFMNDPANLLAVETNVNRDKGPAGPLEWLPPRLDFHCQYLLRFSRVLTRYSLALTPEENRAMELLTTEKCDNG